MGGKPSVEFTKNADSSTEAGQKVIVSQPLEVPQDPNAFIDELLEYMRYPVDSMKGYVVKTCDVEEHANDEFTIKVVLDGKKLDKYRKGKGDGTDRIDLWTRIVTNRQARTIESRPIVPPQGCWANEVDSIKQGGYGHFQILTDPLRVEFYIMTADGMRLAEDYAVAAAIPTVAYAVTNMQKRKVKVHAEQDSLVCSGRKSVISEPMDEFIDFDTFFERFLDTIKEHHSPGIKPKVTVVSAEEFHTFVEVPESEMQIVTKVSHSKESGEIHVETLTDGERTGGSHTKLHRDPLRVESWGEDASGKRESGRATAKTLQDYVDYIMSKKSRSWFG